jgi:hypothetical protein
MLEELQRRNYSPSTIRGYLVDPEKVVFIHSGIAHGGPEGLAG